MSVSRVSLRNRFPEIMAELPVRVDEAIHRGADHIASQAKANELVAEGGELESFDPSLDESIEARVVGKNQAGVYALWRWFLMEYGTVYQPARPFMIPAAEDSYADVIAYVNEELQSL